MMEPVFVCISNMVIMVIFAKCAIHFDKWWIILFGLLAMASYKADKPAKEKTDEEVQPSDSQDQHEDHGF